ncbi:MAG: hypothetical protein V4812_08145 [Pseudomonadota bacterium]
MSVLVDIQLCAAAANSQVFRENALVAFHRPRRHPAFGLLAREFQYFGIRADAFMPK